MFRLIRFLLVLLICQPLGIVSRNGGILRLWACLVGFAFWKLLVILMLAHTIRIFMLCLSFLVVAGSLSMIGGSGVGSWPHGMPPSCLSIFALWMALNRLLRRFQSMSSKILILPGRLGFRSFPNYTRRLLMSVVFLLLAVGVTLAALWVLSTLMPIL